MIRFLHISDTHFGPTKDFTLHGKNTWNDNQRLVRFIKELPFTVDFVMHTGDLAASQNEECYALAEETLREIPGPLYFVTGNHDKPSALKLFPLFGKHVETIKSNDSVSYTFESSDLLGIVIDVKHHNDNTPSGILTDETLRMVEDVLEKSRKRFALFTHFPLLSFDAPWIDSHLLLDRGKDLHGVLVRHRERCAGVFLGHIHQASALSCDGIQYYSAPSTSFLFGGWPSDDKIISYNFSGLPGCNLVTIDERSTLVKYLHYHRE